MQTRTDIASIVNRFGQPVCELQTTHLGKDRKYIRLDVSLEDLYELMKAVSQDERLQKAVRAIYRINLTLKNIMGRGGEYKHKTEIVNTIQRAEKAIRGLNV